MVLHQKVQSGELELLDDDQVVEELRLFIEHLNGIQSYLVSDHILNLLEEIEGKFPQDKKRLLDTIDHYLALPAQERLLFVVGRRGGLYRRLDDLQNQEARLRVEQAISLLKEQGEEKIEETIKSMMSNYI
jgi:hypothetical protein